MKLTRFAILAVASTVFSASAVAQGLPTRKKLTIELAQALAQEALAACRASGYKVSVTVVDADNGLKVALRDDDAFPSSGDSATSKAVTVILIGRDSGAPAGAPPPTPGTTNFPGGVAVKVDGQIIGAVGVSGAPGGERDAVCAKAAVTKLEDRLK